MPPETKFIIFYAISLALFGVLLVWLDHRISQRERA